MPYKKKILNQDKEENLKICLYNPHKEIKKSVLIRLSPFTLQEISNLMNYRKIRTTRHQWIEEAIQSKIEKENKKYSKSS